MRPIMLNLALLMMAPFASKTIIHNQEQPKFPSRSIASLEEIKKDLEDTLKEKLKKKISERDAAKLEVEANEKDDNCKDELKASKEKLKKLEGEVTELEKIKLDDVNNNLIICSKETKPGVLNSAIADLIAQQQYTLSMYNQMQNLLLGYQIQNMYFEISKPTYTDLGQHSLSLNSILGMSTFMPWINPSLPMPSAETYNFSSPEDQASEAYNKMIPDVSRNPLYSPNWGGFSLDRGHMPSTQSFDFGVPQTYQFDPSVTDVSQNSLYQPSMNGFSENMMGEIPVNSYNFN